MYMHAYLLCMLMHGGVCHCNSFPAMVQFAQLGVILVLRLELSHHCMRHGMFRTRHNTLSPHQYSSIIKANSFPFIAKLIKMKTGCY